MPVDFIQVECQDKQKKQENSQDITKYTSARTNQHHQTYIQTQYFLDKHVTLNQSLNIESANKQDDIQDKKNNQQQYITKLKYGGIQSKSVFKKNARQKTNIKIKKSQSQESVWTFQSQVNQFQSQLDHDIIHKQTQFTFDELQSRKDQLQIELKSAQSQKQFQDEHIEQQPQLKVTRRDQKNSKHNKTQIDQAKYKEEIDRQQIKITRLQNQLASDKLKHENLTNALLAKLDILSQNQERNSSLINNYSMLIDVQNDNIGKVKSQCHECLKMKKNLAEQKEKLDITYEVNNLLKLEVEKLNNLMKHNPMGQSAHRYAHDNQLKTIQDQYSQLEISQRQQKKDFLEREINYISKIRSYYDQNQLTKDSQSHLEKALIKIKQQKRQKDALKNLVKETQDQLQEMITENQELVKQLPQINQNFNTNRQTLPKLKNEKLTHHTIDLSFCPTIVNQTDTQIVESSKLN